MIQGHASVIHGCPRKPGTHRVTMENEFSLQTQIKYTVHTADGQSQAEHSPLFACHLCINYCSRLGVVQVISLIFEEEPGADTLLDDNQCKLRTKTKRNKNTDINKNIY